MMYRDVQVGLVANFVLWQRIKHWTSQLWPKVEDHFLQIPVFYMIFDLTKGFGMQPLESFKGNCHILEYF